MEFTRGDTYKFKFQRLDKDNQPIMTKADKMWFTVKDNYYTNNILFQKTLENNTITFTDDGYYHITINPEDTNNLEFRDYYFDIQREINENILTIAKDTLTLTYEVTSANDEVV